MAERTKERAAVDDVADEKEEEYGSWHWAPLDPACLPSITSYFLSPLYSLIDLIPGGNIFSRLIPAQLPCSAH